MNQGKQIMVVEDEAKLADVLIDYLHSAGYTTTHFDRGSGVVEQVKSDPPDLILLDLMLPGPGSRYFCGSLFWASKPKQAANT
ncbi:hypothetical protein BOW53_05565 [Solemya pervernicosa gill symbiont]|uniref:Response regulatory domain-containing protein n=1 Tax=Solemya pervernicosa gill symbiont TaxID=642797 RepID=A0A1T2L7G6_9GAMM|nr:response regulator [Solemya pervernicosa gill symbiont]OOZ40992.1 hypothetical protein BOW53_05565 [Solemya pervernicosa gill symbiont]